MPDRRMHTVRMNRSSLVLAENPGTMEILSGEERLQRATQYATTLDDVSRQIDIELKLLEFEVRQGIVDETANEIRQILEHRQNVIAPLAAEYGSVQVANLAPGVGGMAPVDGEVSEIYVSANQVAHGAKADLQGILVHEERHTDQVDLQSGNGAVLIVDGQEVTDDTVLLEGDTETHVIDVTGYDRNDRPAAVYGEGKDVADGIRENHEGLWNEVLTETGKVEDLQNAVWMDGVEQGTLSSEEIAQQAEQTGYMFNDKFIATQNAVWAEAIESGRVTAQEVQEVAQLLGIELSSEVNRAIAKVAAGTRELYLSGPTSTRRSVALGA